MNPDTPAPAPTHHITHARIARLIGDDVVHVVGDADVEAISARIDGEVVIVHVRTKDNVLFTDVVPLNNVDAIQLVEHPLAQVVPLEAA